MRVKNNSPRLVASLLSACRIRCVSEYGKRPYTLRSLGCHLPAVSTTSYSLDDTLLGNESWRWPMSGASVLAASVLIMNCASSGRPVDTSASRSTTYALSYVRDLEKRALSKRSSLEMLQLRLTRGTKRTTKKCINKNAVLSRRPRDDCKSVIRTHFEKMYFETECTMAVQDHPRSLISIPIESAYASFY